MVVVTTYVRLPYLRQWRTRLWWSQERLSEVSGVSRQTISSAEQDRPVLPSTGLALAEALGIEPSELQHPPPD